MGERLKGLRDAMASIQREAVPFEPAVFDDEVASKTDWGPAYGGGGNFATHVLGESSPERLQFVPSGSSLGFTAVFLGGAILSLVGGAAAADDIDASVGVVVGTIFVLFALPFFLVVYLLRRIYTPMTFDRQVGAFWIGRKGPESVDSPDLLEGYVSLDEVYALQIIKERCRGENTHYWSHELNLVRADGSRQNVLDFRDLETLRAYAAAVSTFLGGIPIWDAVD